jgi:hypothetical protein
MTKLVGISIAAAALFLFGCGGGGLSASSSCEEFLAASPEDQQQTISKLSSEFDTPELTTPLGEPNVAYVCASSPDMTLEEVFQRTHEAEAG